MANWGFVRSMVAAGAMALVAGEGRGQETTATAAAGVRKVKDVVLYKNARFHCAFPSVVALPNGELLCAFRRAPSRRTIYGASHDRHVDANSYLVTVRSKDGGETWTTSPELLYAHPFGGSQDPCLLSLNDGSLLCASYGWAPVPPDQAPALKGKVMFAQEFGFLGGYLLRSEDQGRSWAGPIYPPAVPGSVYESAIGGPLPAYNRGALAQAKDGAILWAAARASGNPRRTNVQLMRSEDRGDTWTHVSEIASDTSVTLNETSLVFTSGGDLLAFLRAEVNGGSVGVARSRDGGKTFEPWKNLGFHGLPTQAIALPGKRLLLVYGYREKPYGVRVKVIKEDLSDAATATEVVLRDDGGSRDVGYPWALQLKDNRILVVYYINVAGAPPHIAGTLLELDK